ncbi:hypothetical protein R3X26_09345 [Vibrio sp. TH_r3]|uniref:hypothetical protein n=1 Tax=Vibrio sp. TH_r3 TaxID=3082084 RepID=UPI002953C5ED|nr:hypothetical protein [Vibrio sp. TH_r3]MDV7104599.1 hypothetical protein [Vibrio sp. TH_r3]
MNGLSEAISLLDSSNNLHYQIWMFYVVVVIGLLGFRFSETYVNLAKYKKNLILLGFIAFSVSNFIAMHQNMIHFNVVLENIQTSTFSNTDINFKNIFDSYHHKVVWRILGFHVLVTVMLSYILHRKKN